MKKIFWVFFLLLIGVAAAEHAYAIPCGVDGIVPCGQYPNCPCDITDVFIILTNIYFFVVAWIATPLAVIAIVIGAVIMMISAGNPQALGTGKKVLYAGIIGLVLVLCSWLIIDFVLSALGYRGSWNRL